MSISCILTLLIKRSVWSKCRPYIFGASPDGDSIFTHTSMPLRASVSGLWLASMPVTTPTSKNYKTQSFEINPQLQELTLSIPHWEYCWTYLPPLPSGREGIEGLPKLLGFSSVIFVFFDTCVLDKKTVAQWNGVNSVMLESSGEISFYDFIFSVESQ